MIVRTVEDLRAALAALPGGARVVIRIPAGPATRRRSFMFENPDVLIIEDRWVCLRPDEKSEDGDDDRVPPEEWPL